jgi:hypothetical protein
MASIQSIRDGIGTRIKTITSLNVYDTIPDSVIVPCAVVGMPNAVEYDYSFRSVRMRLVVPVRVYACDVQEDQAQRKLDDYVSPDGAQSIRAAIDGDVTLGGNAQTTRVMTAQGYGVYELAGVQYLGVEFSVEVIA